MAKQYLMSDDEIRQAHAEYQTGLSLIKVAQLHYVSEWCIEYGFKRLGLPKRKCYEHKQRSLVTPEQVTQAQKDYQAGSKTVIELAAELGISPKHLRDRFIRAGYPTRRVK